MNRLWAPWRANYISNIDNKNEDCIFCTKPKENKDAENLILKRHETCFVIMNRYPYNNGHLLIVPYKHTGQISDLLPQEKLELFETVDKCLAGLKKTHKPDGFNIGMNIGRVAGAGIDKHIHLHIVPRWNGDTNFMPVIGGAKVISESLEECYNHLFEVLNGK